MNVTMADLERVRELSLEYYRAEDSQIRGIIVYGGAARNFTGDDHDPGDFDLNIFFTRRSAISSTYGMPEVIGEYNGLKVEVMRNKVPENLTIREYIHGQDSKRWQRIRQDPIVQIFPTIERISL